MCTAESDPLSVACPMCLRPAGKTCVAPDQRDRAPHEARKLALRQREFEVYQFQTLKHS
jgi:hypothetical protein